MAKDDEKKPTAADKGKGKAVNGDAEKKDDTKADGKDKKPETTGGTSCLRPDSFGRALTANTEELSEEDQQLKSELDMLVERILVCRCSRHHTTPCRVLLSAAGANILCTGNRF